MKKDNIHIIKERHIQPIYTMGCPYPITMQITEEGGKSYMQTTSEGEKYFTKQQERAKEEYRQTIIKICDEIIEILESKNTSIEDMYMYIMMETLDYSEFNEYYYDRYEY